MLQPKRLLSIDVLRAINMFFMIFVNDLSGVSHVPKWIDHVKGYEDGMHFADTIFPLFLFIAGLSIPLAIGRRIEKGTSFTSIAGYILLRSFALIVMGFFHVNMEEYSKQAFLPLPVWELLLTISFFLIWMDYPETLAKTKRYALIGTGIVIIAVLAFLYKGVAEDGGTRWLEPSWWGILGLIGWAYLVCSGVYLLTKGNFTGLIIALLLLVAINLIVHGKPVINGEVLRLKIWVIKDGSCAALMMFGVVISLLYSKIIAKGSYKWLWPAFTVLGAALIALGFFVRPYTQGISKIHSTPAWIFLCTGIGILMFELIIFLVDVKGKQNWFKIIKPAGTSTLTCYLIPYLLVALMSLVHFRYPEFLDEGAGGIIRSFAISFIVILITGVLEKRRIRLKI
jgi:heparan-alpha-glucosaminide N-acetyltransferase